VRSNSNYIEKSKPIDIEVDVYTKNGIGKKGQLTVELLGAEADIIDVLQKEIDFSLEEQTISFSDKVFAVEDIHKSIKIIKVQLRDAIGNMVDQVELDVQSETPIIAPEIQGSLDKGLYKYIVYGIVILLVLSLTVYAIVNKKKSVAIGLWIVIGVWGSSVLIQNSLYPNVLNAETVSKKTKTHLIVEKSVAAINGLPRKRDRFMGVEGNLGTCPQTATVAFAAWHSCPHCANGIRLELQVDQKTDIVRQQINSQGQVVTQVVSNISRPVFFDTIQFPGGMINNFGTPIFAKTFQLTSEDNMLKYRVVANSVRTSPPHGYCLASGKSSPEYTISCTPSSSVLPLTPMVISGIQAPNCLATHTINWTPLNTGEVEYDIYRSLEVDSNYIKIGSTPVVPGQSTYSFEDVDSPIGTFFYRIQPVGGSNTLMSNSISMTKPLTCNNCQLNPSAPGCNTCTAGQIYCNALDECVTDIEACPNMCGNPDVQVGIGLALDTPNLCTAGFTPESPCVNVTQSTRTSCSKACPIGTIISNTNLGQTMCVEPITDICPNIPGDQVNNVYRRYENGDCILPLGTIDYFRLTPDTSDLECPAYWTTSIEDGAYMTCTLNGQSVANQNPVGGTPVNVQTGKRHDLQCNVYITEGDVLTGTVISNARCFRKTNVIER
jgi:hypothetical protein